MTLGESGAVSVGTLYANLKLNKSEFEKALHGSGGLFSSFARVAVAGAAIITTALIGIGVESARVAESQARSEDRIRRVLGKSGDDFIAWAKKNEIALRQSDIHLEQFGATAIQAFSGMGFSMAKATTMTQTLMQRAADISATTGKSFEQVFTALLKGTQGNTRGLKDLGIVVDSTSLKQEALTLGIYNGKGALTTAQKAAAAYALELKISASNAGAAAAKQDTMAESLKIIPVLFDKILEALGRVFLPLIAHILPGVVAGLTAIADWVDANIPAIQVVFGKLFSFLSAGWYFLSNNVFPLVSGAISAIVDAVRPVVEDWIPKLQKVASDAFTTIQGVISNASGGWDSFKKALQPLFDTLSGLLPKISGFFDSIGKIAGTSLSGFATDLLKLAGAIATLAIQLTQDVLNALGGFLDWANKTGIPATVIKILADALDQIAKVLTSITDWVIATPEARASLIAFLALITAQSIIEGSAGAAVGLWAMAGAIGALVVEAAPIIALAVAIGLLVTHWDDFTLGVKFSTGTIYGAFMALITGVGMVGTAISTVIDTATGAWHRFWVTIDTIIGAINGVINSVATTVGKMADTISTAFDKAVGLLKGAVNAILRGINAVFTAWNRISFTVPRIDLPFGNSVGGWTVGTPNIGLLSYLAKGGVVTQPTLAMLGEGNKREAVVPLDDPRYADLFKPSKVMNNYLTVQGDLRAPDAPSVLTTLQRMAEVAGG